MIVFNIVRMVLLFFAIVMLNDGVIEAINFKDRLNVLYNKEDSVEKQIVRIKCSIIGSVFFCSFVFCYIFTMGLREVCVGKEKK